MAYMTHADLGGLPVMAPIVMVPEAEVFHAAWEARVLALTIAMGATGAWNLDMMRAQRETLANYRNLSYYDIWINALANMLLLKGLVTDVELSAQRSMHPPKALTRVLRGTDVAPALARGAPSERPANEPALYCVGQSVRARSMLAAHHTRLPAYVFGKTGAVEKVRGVHVFADSNSQGLGEMPQWLYSVVFDSTELWGDSGSSSTKVSVDAFEPYLEAM